MPLTWGTMMSQFSRTLPGALGTSQHFVGEGTGRPWRAEPGCLPAGRTVVQEQRAGHAPPAEWLSKVSSIMPRGRKAAGVFSEVGQLKSPTLE